ncbi:MAG TPA: aspartate/glutamate racemase family protein [Anaerolineae bacterium]|nr:aspartate/glutamate racemase family protein [Anaerolineae bacterium]
MEYTFLSTAELKGQRSTIRKGQYIAGYAIGIIHLQVWYPLIPGNVVNATTYNFPVRMKLLQGGTQDKIHRGDPSVLDAIIEAGRELQNEGVRAIAGACGYLGNYQREVAAALDVPVYLSSLIQVPMIHRGLKPQQRIGILCADGPALTPSILTACGVTSDIPISIMGLENKPEFSKITYSRGEFDADLIEQEVVESAQQLVAEHSDTGAILLECSDMPPFAYAVQRAVQLPVFDFITMINWLFHSVVQRPYEGI